MTTTGDYWVTGDTESQFPDLLRPPCCLPPARAIILRPRDPGPPPARRRTIREAVPPRISYHAAPCRPSVPRPRTALPFRPDPVPATLAGLRFLRLVIPMATPDPSPRSQPVPLRSLPTTWVLPTVAAVATVRVGQQRSPARNSGAHPTPYLRAANIHDGRLDLSSVLEMDFAPSERRVFSLDPGDILVAEASGSPSQVGRSAIWRGEIPACCYQNTVIRVRPHAVRSEFAHLVFRYYLASGVFSATSRGVGIQHLGATRLSELPFPVPPQNEQDRIVQEVRVRETALQSSIHSLESARRHLKERDDLILQAASTGEILNMPRPSSTPTTAPTGPHPGPDLTLPTSLPSASSPPHSPISPPLPAGWSYVRVTDAGSVRLGKQLTPHHRTGGRLRKYLRVANVYESRIDTTDVKQMLFTPAEYFTYRLRSGDILLNEGQSPELVGRPAIYRNEVSGACFQNALIRFRASVTVLPEYALLIFRHYLRSRVFRGIAKWSTNIAHLGLQRFAALPFPLPPISVQRQITAIAHHQLDASQAQAAAVANALHRLLQMQLELFRSAVSGELLPQDPADEPATALLARLRPAPTTGSPPAPRATTKEYYRMPTKEAPPRNLRDVLRQATKPLRLPALYARAGYDPGLTEDVEQFYLQLRAEHGRSIRTVGDDVENALLEANGETP